MMNFETMILILGGKSAQVVKQFEKAIKPYVTEVRQIRKK